MTNSSVKIRPIAFYLPQFHPIPENDEWWGKGFTEWTNVAKTKPLFRGHYQPHLPADLGFYDLRLPEVRQAQAELAQEYGIYGFCYYHYWFNGKRLLERPFNEVLNSGKPDFPFCLCWANENWTRRWDGAEQQVIMQQVYSEEDDLRHIRWLAKAFLDPRYIRINDKPLFLVYRASKIPNPQRTAEIWRDEARKIGVGEIFLCKVESFLTEHSDPQLMGFDAAVEFQPRFGETEAIRQARLWFWIRKLGITNKIYGQHWILDYKTVVANALAKAAAAYVRFPCVTPSWDNYARRKMNSLIMLNSNPTLYEHWLKTVIEENISNPALDGVVFINAWNEWAEGNHLEPCAKWGHGYLEATRNAVQAATKL